MPTTFTNQATLSFNGQDIPSNIVTGVIESILRVTKFAVAEEYRAGDTVTYVVSIINTSSAPLTDLTVSDDLGAYTFDMETLRPLSYVDGSIQYYQNGVLQPDPDVSTTDGLVLTGITVPANGNVLLVYAATVNEFAPLEAGSTIDNTVTVSGESICDAVANETITVISEALLSIIKSVTPIPVAENGELTYTFQLLNYGNTAVTADDDAIVTDTFDPILSDISVTLNGTPLTTADYDYSEATGVFSTDEGVISIPAATFTQDPETGEWTTTPGSATLTVTGTISSCP